MGGEGGERKVKGQTGERKVMVEWEGGRGERIQVGQVKT